jgi:AraC-like DNA-binding protein
MTSRPQSPPSIDVLSEVLQAVRLSGAIFFNFDARAPWVVEAPPGHMIAPYVVPGAEHVIEYHVVAAGECWAGLPGEPGQRLSTGEVIVFPQGDAHIVSSAPAMRGEQQSLEVFRRPPGTSLPLQMSVEGDGHRTILVCGFIGCDVRPFNPLLAALPRVLHIPQLEAWIDQLLRVAVTESGARSPGSEGMLARLSEMLFISAVRHYLATLPPDAIGWLAGLRDDAIGRALRVLHERVTHDWSLDELAKETGLSRTVLAERFQHFVGVPPMRYLARWRMQLACSMLSSGSLSLAEIATRVGYGSETALSRAFKREIGVSPAAWREGTRPDALPVVDDDTSL